MRAIVIGLGGLVAASCAPAERVETADVNARTALYSAREMAHRIDELEARVEALEAQEARKVRRAQTPLPRLNPYPDHRPAE